jgi:peptidoglycan/LPS O-acetylase OafA/YrhL
VPCRNFQFPEFLEAKDTKNIAGAALTAMIIFTSVAGYCLRYGREVQDLGLQGISAVFSMANITLWIMAGDYWGSSAESALLLHTWSLSVEEQFYLFFPAFIFIVIKFIPKYVFVAVSVLAVTSLALYLYGADRHAAETFYLLPTRIWELAAGSLLAVRSMNQACNSKKNIRVFSSYWRVIGRWILRVFIEPSCEKWLSFFSCSGCIADSYGSGK